MQTAILNLFRTAFGTGITEMEALPASGSARCYFRLTYAGRSYIATYNRDIQENTLFIDFSRHFRQKDLRVPEIYAVSEDRISYIQQDLGETMLLDVVEQDRDGEILSPSVMELYKRSLSELLRFQLLGRQGLDYSRCVPRPVFDKQCIQWDLNYFKYCFLRLAGVDFSEQKLEDDFKQLIEIVGNADTNYFMFRDFQSRNIMVHDGEVWFIDYQGGRQGALHYDVASLLYDAIAWIPDHQRDELLDFYMNGLAGYQPVETGEFRAVYYHFVLVRLLQAMGAFGLRGLHERKVHFIKSIIPGLQNILSLFVPGKLDGKFPEIQKAVSLSLQVQQNRS